MSNRLIVNSSSFKSSMPGYDASSARPEQLSFDAFSAYPYNGAYLSGYFAANYAGWQNKGEYYELYISFGITYPAPPQVIIRFDDPNHNGCRCSQYLGGSPYSAQSDPSYVYVTTTITTQGINIQFHHQQGTFNAPLGVAYLVFEV